MTHDPLCPFFYDHTGRELVRQTGNPCTYCDLIARVREDMRAKATQLFADFEIVKALVADADEVHDNALRDAARAVEALHMEWNLDGPDHVCDSHVEHNLLVRAVAAIEALGGEQ